MIVDTDQRPKHLYEFGPFRVDPEKELLLRQGEPVPLTPKTFQMLLVLMRHHKEIVTKDDLLKTVWPDTFVEESNLSRNIFLLRKALGESPQDHQYIVTVPGRGYRFAENVQLVPEREVSPVAAQDTEVEVQVEESKRRWWIAAGAALALLAAVGVSRSWHRPAVLTEMDTVVLADFMNSTGDPVFDETLQQGLRVQLEQSPFVSLVSDARIRQTLELMGQSADDRVNRETAYRICQRTDSVVIVDGSIASLGNQYVLGLKAVNCRTGDSVAEEQESVTGKEHVLAALDAAAVKLRQRLGESHSSLERFDTPLEQATTPSLEALQAYGLARRNMVGRGEFAEAIPFFRRAIELDPKFAMAYAAMGSDYWTRGDSTTAQESIRMAYELRARVSEAERFYIESTYFHYVTGDLEKAREVYEQSAQTFPRYSGVPLRLWVLYTNLGQHEKALTEIQEAIRLDPSRAINYTDLVASYIHLDRPDEAAGAARDAQIKAHDSSGVRYGLYQVAFLRNDAAAMAEQLKWAMGKADSERRLLGLEGDTAAYFGQMRRSRELANRVVGSVLRARDEELAAGYLVSGAVSNALYGNFSEARKIAQSAMERAKPRDAEFGAAFALAFAGDARRAQLVSEDLARRFPEDTIVQLNYLPVIRAQLAVNRSQSSTAIELLKVTEPYELACPKGESFSPRLYPIYVRGMAHLAAGNADAAAAEFDKILAHRGLAGNEPIGALARLQLGRAYAMEGDTAKAKAAYQNFLTLWKYADPDVPILKQAKAEYAAL